MKVFLNNFFKGTLVSVRLRVTVVRGYPQALTIHHSLLIHN